MPSWYQEFEVAGWDEGRREEFQGGELVGSAGGWEALKRRKGEERERGGKRVSGSGEFAEELLAEEETPRSLPSKAPEHVVAKLSQTHGIPVEEILRPSTERRTTAARADFYVRAQAEAAQPLADLARMAGRSQPAVWQAVQNSRHPWCTCNVNSPSGARMS